MVAAGVARVVSRLPWQLVSVSRVSEGSLTRLAEVRRSRGISQDRLAALIGISGTTYREIETGRNLNPPIGYLANRTLVLGCELEELIDPRYRAWYRRHPGMPGPPDDPSVHWNTSRGPASAR